MLDRNIFLVSCDGLYPAPLAKVGRLPCRGPPVKGRYFPGDSRGGRAASPPLRRACALGVPEVRLWARPPPTRSLHVPAACTCTLPLCTAHGRAPVRAPAAASSHTVR